MQYLCASSIKNLLYENWTQVSTTDKNDIKYFIFNFLQGKGLACERQTLNMMMALLARIIKLTWFDINSSNATVTELFTLFDVRIVLVHDFSAD